jgi:hypothetical protein
MFVAVLDATQAATQLGVDCYGYDEQGLLQGALNSTIARITLILWWFDE